MARAQPPPPPRSGRAAHAVGSKAVVRIEAAASPKKPGAAPFASIHRNTTIARPSSSAKPFSNDAHCFGCSGACSLYLFSTSSTLLGRRSCKTHLVD
jgi:hypothetical protein